MNQQKRTQYYGGIDPSGSGNKPSGCVVLNSQSELIAYELCKTDADILDFFQPYRLRAIAIDAPKGLPLGMGLCCLEDSPACDCLLTGARECERMARQRRIALYPVTKKSFAKAWIRRGLLLFLRFQGSGIPAFEAYPSGSKRLLFPGHEFPKPKSGLPARKKLQECLSGLIANIPGTGEMTLSDHVLDAVLAAYTVLMYKERKQGELIGNPSEGQILLPESVVNG